MLGLRHQINSNSVLILPGSLLHRTDLVRLGPCGFCLSAMFDLPDKWVSICGLRKIEHMDLRSPNSKFKREHVLSLDTGNR